MKLDKYDIHIAVQLIVRINIAIFQNNYKRCYNELKLSDYLQTCLNGITNATSISDKEIELCGSRIKTRQRSLAKQIRSTPPGFNNDKLALTYTVIHTLTYSPGVVLQSAVVLQSGYRTMNQNVGDVTYIPILLAIYKHYRLIKI